MKVLKIGRDEDCDIRISDEENRISRVHAILRIYPFGSIEIIDNSKNGTKVGGNPITYGQPYPVKRNETVNFADVRRLDWSQVPNPRKRIVTVAALVAALMVVIVAVAMAMHLRGNSDGDNGYDVQFTNGEQPSQQKAIGQTTAPDKPINGNGTGGNEDNGILIDENGHRVYQGIFAGSKDGEEANSGTGSNGPRHSSGHNGGKESGTTGKDNDKGNDKDAGNNENTGDGIREIL